LKRTNQTEQKRLSYMNAIVRKGAGSGGGSAGRNVGMLMGGRVGGAAGTVFDMFMSDRLNFGKTKDASKYLGPGKLGGSSAANEFQPQGSNVKTSAPSRLGTPVKIAGIAAGLSGAAGLGKMIIDSSPVLKAMLKLLNMGIMLILRPIGDFIGFMLRPMLIKFVKEIAIPAYRHGSRIAKEWGTKFGDAIVNFFADPIGTIVGGVVEAFKMGAGFIFGPIIGALGILLNPLLGAFGLDKIEVDSLTNSSFQEGAENKIKDPIDKLREELSTTQETAKTQRDQTKEVLESILEQQGQFLVGSKEYEEHKNEAMYGYKDVTSKEEAIAKGRKIYDDMMKKKNEVIREEAIKEQMGLIGSKNNKIFGPGGLYEDPFCEYAAGGGRNEDEELDPSQMKKTVVILSDAAERILAKFKNYKKGAPGSGTGPQDSTGGGGFDLGKGSVNSREQMELMGKAFKQAGKTGEEVSEVYENMTVEAANQLAAVTETANESSMVLTFHKDIKGNYEMMASDAVQLSTGLAAAHDKILGALNKMRVFTSPSSGKRIYKNQATGVLDELGQSSTVSAPNKYRVEFANGATKEMFLSLAAVGNYKKQAGISVKKLAKGGIINEPIFGMGQRSGKGYLMGEAGPETITPGTGTGGSNTFNITINANGINDLNQLKTTVLRLLKESTSRVGIV